MLTVITQTETSPNAPVATSTRSRGADVAVLVAALGLPLLALVRSGSRGLWADEAFSASTSGLPTGQLLSVLWERELNGGLYLLLLHVLGLSTAPEWLQRVPTAVAIGVAGWCVYRTLLRLVPVRFAVGGAVLFLLHPSVQEAAVTVRFYGFVLLAAAVLTLLMVTGGTTSRSGAVLYGLLAGLSLYFHVLLALLVASQLVWLLWTSSAGRRHVAATLVPLAVVSLPLGVFLVTASDGGQLSWKSPLTLEHILATVGGVVVGPTDGDVLETAVRLLFLTPAILALIAYIRQRGSVPAPVALLLLTVAGPVTAVVLVSFVQSLLVARYLWFVVPAIVMLLVLGWASAGGRLGLLVGSGLVAAAVAGLVRPPAEADETRMAIAAAALEARPGDSVLPLIPFDVAVFRRYAPQEAAGVRWAHHDGGDARAVLSSGAFDPQACLPHARAESGTIFVIGREDTAHAMERLAECSGRVTVMTDYPGAVLARLVPQQAP